MKKILLLFLCIFMLSFAVCSLASCELDLSSLGGLQNPPDNGNPPEPEPEPEPEKTVTVKFVWGNKTLLQQTVGVETGFTEEQLSAIANVSHNGYGFKSWHTSEFKNDGNIYDFTKAPTAEMTLYAERGNLTGKTATWDFDEKTGKLTISGSGDMFNYQHNTDAPWDIYRSKINEISIADGITSIGDYTFNGCTNLTSVEIPEGVTAVGVGAFRKTNVVSVSFPSTLVSIGSCAFYDCDGIVHLQLNEGLQDIGDSAFSYCSSLETVFLTNKIMQFGTSAFKGCENLTSAYYNGTEDQYNQINILLDNFWVNELANTYFFEETKPTFENRGAYWHYDGDGNIEQWYYTVWYLANDKAAVPFVKDYIDASNGVIRSENVSFVENIAYNGYKFCSWKLKTTGAAYSMLEGERIFMDTKLVGVRTAKLSDNKTWMLCGDNVWARISAATLHIKCEGEGSGVMFDYTNIKDAPWHERPYSKVSFDTSVTHIGKYSFTDNTALRYVEVPSNVTSIAPNAFSGCYNLYYVFYNGGYDDMLDAGFGALTEENVVSYAKSESNTDKFGSFWRTVTTGSSSNGTARTAWTYEFIDGDEGTTDDDRYVLTIGGDGTTMVNYLGTALEARPWNSYVTEITEVHIRNGITTVGQYTCDGMSAAKAITLPNSVTRIGENAFKNTLYYQTPSNWKNGALYISKHLIKVDPTLYTDTLFAVEGDVSTPDIGTVSIAENAFEGCSHITAVVIPKTLEGIYSTGMTGLTALETVYYIGTDVQWKALEHTPDVTVYYYAYSRPLEANIPTHWTYYEGTPTPWAQVPTATAPTALTRED